MTTITTRAGKGAPLTNAELDANFTALNSGKLETSATTSDVAEGSNLYFTNARARAALSATGSLSYNSTTGVFSFTQGNSDTVAEGSTNLYFTNARARSALSAGTGISYNSTTGEISSTITQYTDAAARSAISSTTGSADYNSSTGVITIPSTTSHITEGSNLYYTDARVRAAISAGTGISYNSTTGAISSTITQYTDALARAAHSAGTGISYNSTTGVISSTITQYTDALARAALSFTAGSGAYNSSTGVFTIPTNTSHLTNGAGFITDINSSMVTSALGYTPANKAGDTFAGNVTLPVLFCSGASNGVVLEGRDTASNGFTMYVSGNTHRIWSNSASADRLTLDSSGNLTAVGNVTAYSDERLKDYWAPVQDQFVEKLASVKAGTYVRKDTNLVQAGVSAQSLQSVLPEAVDKKDDGYLAVAYGNAALVAAVELAKEIVALKKELAELKGK